MSRFFTRYFTSVLVFMFALPIGTLLFGGFSSGTGLALGAGIAFMAAAFTYIFWPKPMNSSAAAQSPSDSSQSKSEAHSGAYHLPSDGR